MRRGGAVFDPMQEGPAGCRALLHDKSSRQPTEFHPVRRFRILSEAFAPVLFVLRKIAFEEGDMSFIFKSEDMCCYPVEEPAVMADDENAAGKILQSVLQCPHRIDIDVMVGSSSRSTFAPDFSMQARCTLFLSPPERTSTFFC